MSARNPIPVIACITTLALAGCDNPKIPTAVEFLPGESPAAPSPPAPPGPAKPSILEVGKVSLGTISPSDGSCSFWDWESGWVGLCDAFEITAPESGTLHATIKWTDATAALAVFSKSSTGEQIDLACCNSPVLMSLPVDSGVTYRIEVAYVGRPPVYPNISPVEYTIEASLAPIGPEAVAPLSIIVLGDAAHTHHLSQAVVEVVDGRSSGTIGRFDEVSGLYEFESLPQGNVTLRVSAPGFVTFTKRLPVGTNTPAEIELQREPPLVDATSSLTGVTWAGMSRNTAWTGVKLEILDGPLAGIFTFSDEWFGWYNFAGLPRGVIRVRASAPWLLPQIVTVDVAGNTQLDFDMQHR